MQQNTEDNRIFLPGYSWMKYAVQSMQTMNVIKQVINNGGLLNPDSSKYIEALKKEHLESEKGKNTH